MSSSPMLSCTPPWMPKAHPSRSASLVDGPVALVAQVVLELLGAGSRQHGAGEVKLLDDAPQFHYRFFGLVERNESHGLETRVPAGVLVMDPVVVGPRQLDGPVAAHHPAERQTVGRVEDGALDAHVLQELQPPLRSHLGECPFGQEMPVGGVEMIVGGKGTAHGPVADAVVLGHALPDGFVVFHHVAVAVDDRWLIL